MQLVDGDLLRFGNEVIRALHTPGHTAGSMSFVWRDHVFTGDTLLINGCGRTDFQSGSAEVMYHSLTQILFKLPDATTVWPGHDYQGRTHSSIAAERRDNPRVAGKSLEEFKAIMAALHLPKPKRIDEAVPANLSSGVRHDAEGMGVQEMRVAAGYAGDITTGLAYAWWQAGDAVLVDVRTDAEREWVGFVPGRSPLAWKQWPGMAMNPAFDEACAPPCHPAKKRCCCAAAVCAPLQRPNAPPNWVCRPTTFWKVLRATRCQCPPRQQGRLAHARPAVAPGIMAHDFSCTGYWQHAPEVGAIRIPPTRRRLLAQGAEFLENIDKLAEGAWRTLPAPKPHSGLCRGGRRRQAPRARTNGRTVGCVPQWVVASEAEAGLRNGYDHPTRLGPTAGWP
jgi:hypothetical protein